MLGPASKSLAEFVWFTRYRDQTALPPEENIADTWKRVAITVASVERDSARWSERFLDLMHGYRFLPGGRILSGAGSTQRVTLFNCFVMGRIDDSIEGIFEALKEGALTIQQGGGVGYDFSTLRPKSSRAFTTGTISSGPVSFMHVWDAMCATVLSTGARRVAMMGALRCDHPDIEEFIDAKRDPNALRHFNLSVLVTDRFMSAIHSDEQWPLVFPDADHPTGRVHRVVGARELWDRLCSAAYDAADPGILFIDRINEENNLGYCETISAVNPCGEEPLPPYGACNLGSMNLTAYVLAPFTTTARFDYEALRAQVGTAVRFLDNVIDISRFPLFRQREQVHRSRRVGLGITGLADALAMLNLAYDTPPARSAAGRVMSVIRDAAYAASIQLAEEKGSFPEFDAEKYLGQPYIRALPNSLREGIARSGIRNSHLLSIAPTGTISLLTGNVSSGIEPVFGLEVLHRVLDEKGECHNFQAEDYAYSQWRLKHPIPTVLPDYLVGTYSIAPSDHLLMQAELQPYVDGAISKTISLRHDFPRTELSQVLKP